MDFLTPDPGPIPLALVGIGALFPGSPESDGFWRHILRGSDLLTDVPAHYWLIDDHYDPDPTAPLKTYARRGGFIPKVPFDSLGHGIPPTNVPTTDTTQLLALIVAKRVLEDACGLDLGRLDRCRTSVILGVAGGTSMLGSMNATLQRPVWTKALRESGLPETQVQSICAAIESSYTPWTESTFPGLLGNVIAGRVASRFDLGGTNCTIDAACASSLAAFRMAAQELRLGTADLVVTGGVDATNDPLMFTCFSKTPALSRSGDCRPFSADSDGTMLGEGVGMFALRRLADAERDGDRIYAVLRGLGASSDGRAKSIYAPRAAGQMQALRRAYDEAGYSPAEVELVEAHGTGTAAGDAAEVEALKTVFAEANPAARGWCTLGSVKSQIGHAKSSAGAASVYKIVMALHHKVLPPTIKISSPNPALGLEDSPFQLATTARPWVHGRRGPRRAGISSFGFGGSNYHMTIEEYLGATRPQRIRTMPTELVLVSAATPDDAIAQARALAGAPGGFAAAARASQQRFDPSAALRLAFVVADETELAAAIDELAPFVESGRPVRLKRAQLAIGGAAPGRIGLLFPGQGSQYVGMGGDLAIAFDSARAVWDAAASDHVPGCDTLHRATFPPTAFDDAAKAAQTAALTATEVAQPAIGVTSQMMLGLLHAAGIRPAAVAGHSYGELSALHCAGVFDSHGLHSASAARGALMAEAARTTAGAMLAVFRPAAEIAALLASSASPSVVIANHNAPEQIVLAGPVDAIAAVAARLADLRIEHRRLPVATAFHSPIVSPACAPFRAALETIAVSAPTLTVFGCTDAAPYPSDPAAIRDRLARQLAEPVRFTDQIAAMAAAGIDTFIEVGPGATLTELTGRILAGRPHLALAMDRRGRHGVTQLWELLGTLALAGHRLDFSFAWNGFAETVPPPVKHNAATLMIDGSTYGKPYPPAGGSAALPRPNPDIPPSDSTELPLMTDRTPTTPPALSPEHPTGGRALPAEPGRMSALIEALRFTAEAHMASQRAMAVAHAAYLRQTEALISRVSGETVGEFDLSEVTQALGLASPAPMPDEPTAPALPAEPARQDPQAGLSMPVPVPPPVDIATPAPAPVLVAQPPSQPPALATPAIPASPLIGTLLAIVADKTGYPLEMLDPDMELEADLGIDSIKRVEILAALRAAAPDLPDVDARDLAGLRTLSAILQRLGSAMPAQQATPAPAASPAPVPAPAAAHAPLSGTLLAIVADKTGYPVEMLAPEMELEADLGIDSIKRVEILAALRAAVPDLPEVDARELAGLRTLSAILGRLSATSPLPAPPPAPTPAASDLAALLLAIVADKTGYPVEMLSPEMELEADLGIDSIKRVEILAALRTAAPTLPDVDARDLAGLRTLRAILARLGGVAAEPVAPVAPVAPVTPVRAPSPPQPDLATTLLEIVADKTGYPVEMLSPDMELEADLGVDSIKRVEILAAFRATAPQLPEVDARELAGLRTLRAILDRLGSGAAPRTPPAHPIAYKLPRIGLQPVPAPRTHGRPALSAGMTVTLSGGPADLAASLARRLTESGLTVLPADRIDAGDAVIDLHGLAPAEASAEVLRLHHGAFAAARAFAPRATRPGAVFITVQDTGGDFGLSGAGPGAWRSGMAGIAKTAAVEWPDAIVRCLDLECGAQTPDQLADRLLAELLHGDRAPEIGLRADGTRLALAETPLGTASAPAPDLPERPVLVVSGGGRGVVAACLRALARLVRPRLLLLGRTALQTEPAGLPQTASQAELSRALYEHARREGRSPTPRQLGLEAARILADREIRANIAALTEAGAEVRYRSVDVTDAAAVGRDIAAARADWGRIDGLVHGAGVLSDKLIADQSDEAFALVFRTKVDGLAALLEATRADRLVRICLFSSVAGRYGNRGQVAYAAANEVLNKVAQHEARQRGAACRVVSLNWGPWDGGMVTDGLRAAFASRGVPLIDVTEGAEAFAAEMIGPAQQGPAGSVEIVLGGRLVDATPPIPAFAS